MERPTLYLCDPEKNTECSKVRCAYNICSFAPSCRVTKHPGFAVLNEKGEPIPAQTALWSADRVNPVSWLNELTESVKDLSVMIKQEHEQCADNGADKRIKKLEASVSFLFGLFFGQFLYLLLKQIFFV